jgi:hypothetical protein
LCKIIEFLSDVKIGKITVKDTHGLGGNGWAVDGFVRTANGDPVDGVTVAAYDGQERWYAELGYGCTDEQGYFSIVVEKPAKEPPNLVFMRASKGKKLLPSNEVQLAPAGESSDRVEIIIGNIGSKDDCTPPDGGKGEPRHPEKPVGGKKKPAASEKKKGGNSFKLTIVNG